MPIIRTIFTELLEDAIFDSPNPIVLIIDDVHLIAPKKLVSLLVFLSRTMSRNLCIILLSRNQIFTEEEKMRLGNLLCEITIGDLRLRESEVDLYAKLCGLEVMDDELKELVDISEGWISMVYLNFKSYVQNRTWLYHSENILALINQVMLDPLPESSRQFLILLGMTNEFTKEQAVYLWRNPSAFDLLEDLTKNNAFISKNENGIYRYPQYAPTVYPSKVQRKTGILSKDELFEIRPLAPGFRRLCPCLRSLLQGK